MINKDKIILMTKLAIYDKTDGESDKRLNSFFRHDYVYWKNFWIRLYAFIGCVVIVALYALNKIVIEKQDLFEIDYKAEAMSILFFVIIVLGISTFFGSIKATREYSKAQKRITEHLELTKQLDHMNMNEVDNQPDIPLENLPEGDLPTNHGIHTRRKRNSY